MAGAIKGITVEIGADTSKLTKALRAASAPVNKMQSELRQVERLLKMNPGNMDLIRQKETLLAQSIDKTKINLKEMKAALAEADKDPTKRSSAGYRKLQQEIIKTETKLRELAAEQARMKVMGSSIGIAATRMGELGTRAQELGNKLRGVTMATGLLAGAAVAVTADFDSSMSEVQAVSGATGEQFDKLRDKAREMGSKTKFSASEAAEAMNYMAMAGWKTEDMLSGIDGIMNLAAASGEDLATTSDIVTDGLTAMGYSAQDAGRMADVMAAASSNANTNVSMMGETFKYAASVAGSMGYSMEDVALATGLMANSGIKATQAGTSLRSMISRMAAPTDAVAAAMDKVGVSMTNSDGTTRKFRDVLVDLRKGMKGMTDTEKTQIASTIAGKNAMSGFLAIVNSSDKDFEKLASAIDNSNGAAEEMAATMQDNLGGQVTILKSQMQELAISVGDTLVPMAKKAVKAAQELTDWFNNLSAGGKDTAVKIGLAAGAAGPLLIAAGGLGKAFSASVKSIAAAKAAMAAMTAVEGEATAATKLLGAAQKAMPWMAAAAGAALVAKAIYDTYQATHEATIKTREHNKARQESVDAIKSEAKENEFYLQKLDELAGVEDKTASQKQLMKAYVDRLNGAIDGLNLKYDAEKDKLNQTTEAIQKKIDKMKEEALAAAYVENAKAAYKEYAKAQIEAAEAEDELALKQERLNSLSESEQQTPWAQDLRNEVKQLSATVDDYNGAMDKALQDANKWTNAGQMSSSTWKTLVADAKKAGVQIPQSVKTGLRSGMYQVPQSVKELQSLIKFDDMKNRAVGDAKKTADNLAKGLAAGEVSAQEAAKKLSGAMSGELSKGKSSAKKSGKTTGKGYASGVKSASGSAKSAGKSLKSGASKGATGNLRGQGGTAGKSYASGVRASTRLSKSAGSALKDAAKSGANKKNALRGIGSSIGNGLAAGLRSALGKVRSAASALVGEANRAAKAKAQVNSPSKLFRDGVGKAIPEGLAAGIMSGSGMVAAASTAMIEAANGPATMAAAGGTVRTMAIAASNPAVRNGNSAVYNIGNVSLEVEKLKDVATLEDFFVVVRRAKGFR